MMLEYWCCNHHGHTDLDQQGNCSFCGSAAIVRYPADVEPVYIPEKPGFFCTWRDGLRFLLHIFGAAAFVVSVLLLLSWFSK